MALILPIAIFGLAIYLFIRLSNAPLDAHLAVSSLHHDAHLIYEHQTNKGNFLLFESGGAHSLAFLSRSLNRVQYEYRTAEDTHVVLPKSESVPFTVYAGVSEDDRLHEVIVIETGFPIAHSSHMKPSLIDDETSVWMVASSDLTGADFLIIGLSDTGEVLFEIEGD